MHVVASPTVRMHTLQLYELQTTVQEKYYINET